MTFFICVVPVCPVRAEPAHRSEQTSQLLFGERCELLGRADDFVRIRVLYDNYEGWCQVSQLEGLKENQWVFENKDMAGEWVNKVIINDKPMFVPFGSSLDCLNNQAGFLVKTEMKYEGIFAEPTLSKDLKSLKAITSLFLNTSYLWGGRSVFGIDCSGFTQVVFKCMGISLLRDASQQATQGHLINCLKDVEPGDLAFFNNEAGRITHVGILFDSNTIIHSSGKVRIDTLNSYGIVNNETGMKTHFLHSIKRMAV